MGIGITTHCSSVSELTFVARQAKVVPEATKTWSIGPAIHAMAPVPVVFAESAAGLFLVVETGCSRLMD